MTKRLTKFPIFKKIDLIKEDSKSKKKKNMPNELTVKSWIARYKQNQRNTACELINLVIKSSGSKYVISQTIFESADLTDELIKMDQSNFSEDYPLKEAKKTIKFTNSFVHFWQLLIELCQNNIIFDEYLLPSISAWVIVFSRFFFLFYLLIVFPYVNYI